MLWDAPLSSIRSLSLEPAHEGVKVELSAPVEYSTDHQVCLWSGCVLFRARRCIAGLSVQACAQTGNRLEVRKCRVESESEAG